MPSPATQLPATATVTPAPTRPPPSLIPSGAAAIALINGTLIDGSGAAPLPDAVVVIANGRIVAAGPAGQVNWPADAQVIDVRGATILPGFINAHVHRGYSAENLQAWAQGGVTTVRDLGVAPYDDAFVRRDTLLRDHANARLVAAGPLVTVPGGYPGGRRDLGADA